MSVAAAKWSQEIAPVASSLGKLQEIRLPCMWNLKNPLLETTDKYLFRRFYAGYQENDQGFALANARVAAEACPTLVMIQIPDNYYNPNSKVVKDFTIERDNEGKVVAVHEVDY